MKRYLKKIASAEYGVAGINRRNIEFIYPNNPRKEFRIADDKAVFKGVLEQEGVPMAPTYSIIEHFWEVEEKLKELESRDSMVLKPARGSGGKGILILQQNGKGWLTPDGRRYDRERLRMHIAAILYGAYAHDNSDKVIVEELLIPHPFLTAIYGTGVPDVRILYHHHVPVMGMLRIPTRSSRGKANLHQGAIGIGIEMETGLLGYGMIKGRRTETHPDSGYRFRGLKLPHWDEFIRIGNRTSSMVQLKFLGIDMILDERYGPLVIEINARPGLQIQNSNQQGLLEVMRKLEGEGR
jgi:alpha-L-glutamate ligase-like protein